MNLGFIKKHVKVPKTLVLWMIILFAFNAINSPELFANTHDESDEDAYIVGIDKKHKFIWFRVAKVGSTTIKTIFNKNHLHVNFTTIPFTKSLGQYHDYFKFAFVRNPWDRVVSCYCQKVENKNPSWKFYYGECFDKGFDYFVDFINRKDLITADRHIRLQTSLIPLDNIDFIGRLENFEDDLQHVLSVIGLSVRDIPKKNPSNHLHYSRYYNERTKEIIRQKYQADVEAFGYEFEVQ